MADAIQPGGSSDKMGKIPEKIDTPGREHTKDKSDRFSEDAFLRKFGFTIVSRPNDGPAVWRREGKEFLHHVALRIASNLKKRKDAEAQDLP